MKLVIENVKCAVRRMHYGTMGRRNPGRTRAFSPPAIAFSVVPAANGAFDKANREYRYGYVHVSQGRFRHLLKRPWHSTWCISNRAIHPCLAYGRKESSIDKSCCTSFVAKLSGAHNSTKNESCRLVSFAHHAVERYRQEFAARGRSSGLQPIKTTAYVGRREFHMWSRSSFAFLHLCSKLLIKSAHTPAQSLQSSQRP